MLRAKALLPPAVNLHYHTVKTIWRPAATPDETDCVNVLVCVCVGINHMLRRFFRTVVKFPPFYFHFFTPNGENMTAGLDSAFSVPLHMLGCECA